MKTVLIAITILFSPFSLAISSLCEVTAASKHKKTFERVEAKIESLRREGQIPGLSLSFFKVSSSGTSSPIYSFSKGFTTNGEINKFSPQHLVPVSSVSKIFTTMAIFQLIEKGIVSLEMSLAELPNSSFYQKLKSNPEKLDMLKRIKVKHLLSHQSGIMQDLPGANMWWDLSSISDGSYPGYDIYDEGILDVELLFTPGDIPTGMKYSNLGFNLIAEIIKAYGGETSLESYIRKNILNKLGLTHSNYFIDDQNVDLLSRSHSNRGAAWGSPEDQRFILPIVCQPGSCGGSIGLNSSSHELSLMAQALFKLLDPLSPDTLGVKNQLYNILNPQSQNNKNLSWGHGFALENFEGHLAFGHMGTGHGSRALLKIFPELNWGISAVFNTRDADREKFIVEIMKILIEEGFIRENTDLPPQLVSTLAKIRDFQENTNIESPIPPKVIPWSDVPSELKDYVGIYNADIMGAQYVKATENGKLYFWGSELIPDPNTPDLFHFPANTHPYTSGEPVRFFRDENGQVTAIHALYVLHAPRVSEEY